MNCTIWISFFFVLLSTLLFYCRRRELWSLDYIFPSTQWNLRRFCLLFTQIRIERKRKIVRPSVGCFAHIGYFHDKWIRCTKLRFVYSAVSACDAGIKFYLNNIGQNRIPSFYFLQNCWQSLHVTLEKMCRGCARFCDLLTASLVGPKKRTKK